MNRETRIRFFSARQTSEQFASYWGTRVFKCRWGPGRLCSAPHRPRRPHPSIHKYLHSFFCNSLGHSIIPRPFCPSQHNTHTPDCIVIFGLSICCSGLCVYVYLKCSGPVSQPSSGPLRAETLFARVLSPTCASTINLSAVYLCFEIW